MFGVSADSLKSHDKFICKQSLPFPLISDDSKEVLTAYGVWAEKSLFGKKYMGINRTTIIIDEEGKIDTVLDKVKPGKHINDLLAALTPH